MCLVFLSVACLSKPQVNVTAGVRSRPEMITRLGAGIPRDIRRAVEGGLKGWHRLRRFGQPWPSPPSKPPPLISAPTSPRSCTSSGGSNATSVPGFTTGPLPASPCGPPAAVRHSFWSSRGRTFGRSPQRRHQNSGYAALPPMAADTPTAAWPSRAGQRTATGRRLTGCQENLGPPVLQSGFVI